MTHISGKGQSAPCNPAASPLDTLCCLMPPTFPPYAVLRHTPPPFSRHSRAITATLITNRHMQTENMSSPNTKQIVNVSTFKVDTGIPHEQAEPQDRKSTRLNSSHVRISY